MLACMSGVERGGRRDNMSERKEKQAREASKGEGGIAGALCALVFLRAPSCYPFSLLFQRLPRRLGQCELNLVVF